MLFLKLQIFDLKPQNPSSILTQTHTCDFQRFHINLFLRLFFLLKKFWEKYNGVTYKCVSFQLGPSPNILLCEKIRIPIEKNEKIYNEKTIMFP
jgi:hypothetical protein